MRALNLDPENPMVRTAVFGEQVQEFLRGPIGRYLIERAEKQLAAAFDHLKVAAADDVIRIMTLQAEIRYLEDFEIWLGAAVQDGLTATAALEGEEHHAD